MDGFMLNEMYNELVDDIGADIEALDAIIEEEGWSESTLRNVLYDETGETTFKCEI
jgi:hypothetical protein